MKRVSSLGQGLLALFLAAAPPVSAGEGTQTGAQTGPYLVVLGTAQDGGLPQIGCEAAPCRAARRSPLRLEGGEVTGLERYPTCLLLVDPRKTPSAGEGSRWLFEATPELPRQVALARDLGHMPAPAAGRPALFDGLFLTHAHMGHYSGLVHLGREAWGGAPLPVYASPRMLEFLRTNGPWSLLLEDSRHLRAAPLRAGSPLRLAADLHVEAIPVPHRDELSDTMAFLIQGPEHSALFLPDIDKWSIWDSWPGGARRLEDVLEKVDVALLDATFFADGEIPGRSMADIPHPFVVETLERIAPLSPELRAKVHFIHLNHTNPLASPGSAAAEEVSAAGCKVLREGDVLHLGAGER